MNEVLLSPVHTLDLLKFLRLVHAHQSESEFISLVQELTRDAKRYGMPITLALTVNDDFVGGVYFRFMPGRVATLGGVRVADEYREAVLDAIDVLVEKLQTLSIIQIQAIVSVNDAVSSGILSDAQWYHATTVAHLWKMLDQSIQILSQSDSDAEQSPPKPPNSFSNKSWPTNFTWRSAAQWTVPRLQRLIEATFDGTLDCPVINNIRTPEEVLDSFLGGAPLRTKTTWEILYFDQEPAGCVLVEVHPRDVAELSYMGLIKNFRGRGLGQSLVRRAMEVAALAQRNILVVAADENNWPAMNIYQKAGFQYHQSLEVWLHDAPKP